MASGIIYAKNNLQVDPTLSSVGEAADAAVVGGVLSLSGRIFPRIEHGGLALVDGHITKTESMTLTRLRLANNLTDGMFRIACDDGYFYILWVEGATSGYGDSESTSFSCEVSFNDLNEFSISMGRVDGGNITAEEASHLYIYKITDFYTPEKVKFNSSIRLGDVNAPEAPYTYRSSDIFKIPEGGFSVSIPFVSTNKKYWCASFYKMENGRLKINHDYSYGYMIQQANSSFRTAGTSMTIYYPFEENVYVQIGTMSPDETDITTYDSKDVGRLLTLAPMAVTTVYDTTTTPALLVGFKPTFSSAASGTYTVPQMIYGTIIRTEDAYGICCSPNYSLSAWFYNSEGVLVDSVYSTPSISISVGGPSCIDFRNRNSSFVIVGIRCSTWSIGSTAAERDTDTMGVLAREDDVLDNVHVMWKQHVTITHRNEIPQIIGENIRWLKNFTFPEIKSHNYRGPWTPTNIEYHRSINASLGFYSGHTFANTPLSMVTMESYASALKNPYSRIYSGDWSPYSGSNVQPTGYNLKGYGWICGNLMNILCGYKWYATEAGYYKIPNYNNFEIIKDFSLETDVDELRAGDWLWCQVMSTKTPTGGTPYRFHDYHVMMVTDVIYVNGVPYAVEFLESHPPTVRRRFICLDPLLRQKTQEFGGENPFTAYNMIARPNKSTLRRITDIWDTNISDYTLGKVACDRGHNSVYTTEDEHIYITIFDPSVSTFDIVNIRTSQTISVTISDYFNKIHLYNSDLWTLDIKDTIAGMGFGNYELRVNGVAEEAFLVPAIPNLSITWPGVSDSVQEVVVTPGSSTYTPINIVGWYFPTINTGYPAATASESITYEQDAQTGSWHYVIANDGAYAPPSDATFYRRLKFRISIRPDDMTGGAAHLPYATKFPIGCQAEDPHDYTLRFVTVQYETPNGGFVVGGDRVSSQGQIVERRWANTDNITPYD